MTERYSRLSMLPENLYLDGAPVMIAAGALLKDNTTGGVLAQLKITNLYHAKLTACKVAIKCFDPSGAELRGVEGYSYLDISVARGDDFGSKVAIALPDNTTRKMSVSVTQAIFDDGQIWRNQPAEWTQPTFKVLGIGDVLEDSELQKQYLLDIGDNCCCVPETLGSLTLCACGQIGLSSETTCPLCGRNYKSMLAALDKETLAAEKDLRLAKEEIERQEHEREAEKSKKKRIRIASITAAVLVPAIAAALLVTQVVIPANKYKAAETLLTERNYDAAIAAFEALGDYKDSTHRAEDVPYVRANDLFSDGNYDGALEAFRKLNDYSDAPERVDEILQIKYESAQELMASGKYDLAIDAFTEIIDYSDSRTCIIEANYHKADNALSAGEYDRAIDIFTELGNYSDSETRVLDARYMKARALLEGGSYSEAISLFSEFSDYKDSHDMLLESKYQLAASQLRNEALKDARAGFEELSRSNYKDSAAQLNSVLNTLYDNAAALFEKGEYNEAYTEFNELADFSDSKDRMEQIYNIITDEAFKTLQQKDFNSAYTLFVAAKNTYPSIIGTRLDDQILYTGVKSLDFDNGDRYNLADIYEYIDLIKNDDYKQELLKLPQMKMILQLNGTWEVTHYNGTTYNDTFFNGKSWGDFETYVFYQAGYYYEGMYGNSYRFSDITENQFTQTELLFGRKSYFKRVES